MKYNRIFTILFLLLVFCCDRDEPSKAADDCNGDPDGIAFIDNCGVCSGGNTGHEADSDIDCNNECFGEASVDSCGVCAGDGIASGACDCDGNVFDCLGVCGGSAVIDICGVCNGSNTNEDQCPCLDGSDRDCNGFCESDGDSYGAALNECGVCGGGDLEYNHDCSGNCINGSFRDSCDSCISNSAGLRFNVKSMIVVGGTINEEDIYNYIGLSGDATDGFDIEYDVPEPQGEFKLYFPHDEWGESDNNFTEDIRYLDPGKLYGEGVIWDAIISTQHDAPVMQIDLTIEISLAENCSWCSDSYLSSSVVISINDIFFYFIYCFEIYTDIGTTDFFGDGEGEYRIVVKDVCFNLID